MQLNTHRKPIKNSNYFSIHHDSGFLNIEAVEEMKKAKYVGEFCLKAKDGGYANFPVAVFYQAEKYPGASNYFGLFICPIRNTLLITDAIGVTEETYSGVLNNSGEVLYSAFRHDYQTHGDLMCDGGRDYLRCSIHPVVQFRIVDGELVLHTEESNDATRTMDTDAVPADRRD